MTCPMRSNEPPPGESEASPPARGGRNRFLGNDHCAGRACATMAMFGDLGGGGGRMSVLGLVRGVLGRRFIM